MFSHVNISRVFEEDGAERQKVTLFQKLRPVVGLK